MFLFTFVKTSVPFRGHSELRQMTTDGVSLRKPIIFEYIKRANGNEMPWVCGICIAYLRPTLGVYKEVRRQHADMFSLRSQEFSSLLQAILNHLHSTRRAALQCVCVMARSSEIALPAAVLCSDLPTVSVFLPGRFSTLLSFFLSKRAARGTSFSRRFARVFTGCGRVIHLPNGHERCFGCWA